MPILQSRMIAIIHAGQDYQHALKAYLDRVNKTATLWARGSLSSDDAMAEIFAYSIPSSAHVRLLNDPNSAVIIEAEDRYYRLYERRNLKRRKAQAAKRREDGVPLQRTYVTPSPAEPEPTTPRPPSTPRPSTNPRVGSTELAVELLAKYEREQRQAELTSFELEQAKLAASSDDEVFDPTLLDSGPPAISLTRRPRTEDDLPDD